MIGRELTAPEFIAAMNHELRTPLNAILGFSDLLAEADGLDDRQRRYAAHIRSSGHRLRCLIEDILALARLARDGSAQPAESGDPSPQSRDDGAIGSPSRRISTTAPRCATRLERSSTSSIARSCSARSAVSPEATVAFRDRPSRTWSVSWSAAPGS
jgi:signal transduction histidine kinase